MLILLTAVNEGIDTGFVGAFEDDKVSEILKLPKYILKRQNLLRRLKGLLMI